MAESKSVLTDEIKALIGVTGERVEASLWGIEREDFPRFTQAIMDPDPRYWDEAFAKTTKFGGIVTPPIYCTYLSRKTPPGADDPITRAFLENPESDGIGGVETDRRGALPSIPTHLKRILNAGNEIERPAARQLMSIIQPLPAYSRPPTIHSIGMKTSLPEVGPFWNTALSGRWRRPMFTPGVFVGTRAQVMPRSFSFPRRPSGS